MGNSYIAITNNGRKNDVCFIEIDEARPGGWYRRHREWFGPGTTLAVKAADSTLFNVDLSSYSSRGNPEFLAGDLVEVWDARIAYEAIQNGKGAICTYVRILSGRKEVEVLFNGALIEVSRKCVCPALL
jgi:hypothetical protein